MYVCPFCEYKDTAPLTEHQCWEKAGLVEVVVDTVDARVIGDRYPRRVVRKISLRPAGINQAAPNPAPYPAGTVGKKPNQTGDTIPHAEPTLRVGNKPLRTVHQLW